MGSRLTIVSRMAKKHSSHCRIFVQKIKIKVTFVLLECFHYSRARYSSLSSLYISDLHVPYIANHLRWKSFAVAEFARKKLRLDSSLVWSRPFAQAISLKNFRGYQSTCENFHLRQFAIYGMYCKY